MHGAIDAQRTDALSHEVGIAGDVRIHGGVLQQRLDRRLVELRMRLSQQRCGARRCGDAIDVPWMFRLPVPVPTPAETIETPGADRSGLNVEPPWPGPREENVAI